MRSYLKIVVLSGVLCLASWAAPFSQADAAGVVIVPFLFPPIAECGTVGFVESFFDLDGDGELDLCKVWFADSGGAFLVGGLDPFDEGDRVFVKGVICTTCLTTCPAGAILFAKLGDCP